MQNRSAHVRNMRSSTISNANSMSIGSTESTIRFANNVGLPLENVKYFNKKKPVSSLSNGAPKKNNPTIGATTVNTRTEIEKNSNSYEPVEINEEYMKPSTAFKGMKINGRGPFPDIKKTTRKYKNGSEKNFYSAEQPLKNISYIDVLNLIIDCVDNDILIKKFKVSNVTRMSSEDKTKHDIYNLLSGRTADFNEEQLKGFLENIQFCIPNKGIKSVIKSMFKKITAVPKKIITIMYEGKPFFNRLKIGEIDTNTINYKGDINKETIVNFIINRDNIRNYMYGSLWKEDSEYICIKASSLYNNGFYNMNYFLYNYRVNKPQSKSTNASASQASSLKATIPATGNLLSGMFSGGRRHITKKRRATKHRVMKRRDTRKH